MRLAPSALNIPNTIFKAPIAFEKLVRKCFFILVWMCLLYFFPMIFAFWNYYRLRSAWFLLYREIEMARTTQDSDKTKFINFYYSYLSFQNHYLGFSTFHNLVKANLLGLSPSCLLTWGHSLFPKLGLHSSTFLLPLLGVSFLLGHTLPLQIMPTGQNIF